MSSDAPKQRTALAPIEGVPAPGDLVAGKYRIESILGSGGMGVVMEATHLQLGQPVAIKVLRPSAAARSVIVARVLREARAAIAIQSIHVVRIMDVGTLEHGAPYMVMERLEGSDLDSLLRRRGALPVAEAVSYVVQACDAIGDAHARGIVHRDLKPANIFLTKRVDGRPLIKVLDFGIAKATDLATEGIDHSLTEASAILGSPSYMSPEQVRSAKQVDGRSDIWALGVILFNLIGNALPFEGTTFSSLCAAIVADPPASLKERVPTLDPALEAIIMRCLEKDPADRFQTVPELAAALAPFAALPAVGPSSELDDTVEAAPPSSALEGSAATTAIDTVPAERGKPASRPYVGYAIALVAAIAVGVFTVRSMRGDDPAPTSTSATSSNAASTPVTVSAPLKISPAASSSASAPASPSAATPAASSVSGTASPKPSTKPSSKLPVLPTVATATATATASATATAPAMPSVSVAPSASVKKNTTIDDPL